MRNVQKLTSGPAALVAKFNEMVDAVNSLQGNNYGTGRVSINKTGSGEVFDLGIHQTRNRMPKRRAGGSGIGIVRRARTTEAATANKQITCNIYDHNGIEATEGDEFNVEVHGLFVDAGTAFNSSIGRLRNDEDIAVALLPFDNAGTVEYRWYCWGGLQPTEDCT